MNKNTIIGFILIGVIMFGFSWYQSKQYREQQEYQMEQAAFAAAETMAENLQPKTKVNEQLVKKDTISLASKYPFGLYDYTPAMKGASVVTIANDKLTLELSTRGAQPNTVILSDYKRYGGDPLQIFLPGGSDLDYTLLVEGGFDLHTSEYVFDYVEELSDSSKVVMRLPFTKVDSTSGYIQQTYTLAPGSYVVSSELSIVNLDDEISEAMSSVGFDWDVTIPRLEKGYNNELRYSKLCYQFDGASDMEKVAEGRDGSETLSTKTKWYAFQQQFFSAIATAKDSFVYGDLSVDFMDENDPKHNLMKATSDMEMNVSSDNKYAIDFYFGPNDYKTLKKFGNHYEKMIPLGGWLVGWISRWVIIPVFDFLGKFIHNYGIVILLLTLLIKLVVSPLTIKSYMSSAKMSALKPQMDKLNEKYPRQEDAMKKQQAMMDLYQKAGISPMGGCLPMLLQFPILWAMFRFFPASIELRQQKFLWADDLSAYDSILDFGFNIPLYGDHISLFALLMALSMFLYSKMNSSQMSNDPSMAGMKFMSVWMMPIMMLFICNNLSSGLSYYYLLSNLITMLQTWVIKKYFVNEKKVLAQIEANSHKKKPKSKWQLRLEEAQKMQEQMMKQKNNKR